MHNVRNVYLKSKIVNPVTFDSFIPIYIYVYSYVLPEYAFKQIFM